MNIVQHVLAGNYKRADGSGSVLIPMRNGITAWIYTTEHGGAWPLAGAVPDESYINGRRQLCWQADGRVSVRSGYAAEDLMPPPPRLVETEVWLDLDAHGQICDVRTSVFLVPARTHCVIPGRVQYTLPWKD